LPTRASGWTKATLVLSLSKVWTGGAINVYQFAWGGISSAGPADTLSLKGDPRVFLETESFKDIPGYLKAMIFGDPAHGIGLDAYKQKAIVDTPVGPALQVTFDPRVNGALTAASHSERRGGRQAAWSSGPLPARHAHRTDAGLQVLRWRKLVDQARRRSLLVDLENALTLLAGNGGAKSQQRRVVNQVRHVHVARPAIRWSRPHKVRLLASNPTSTATHLWNGAGFTPKVGSGTAHDALKQYVVGTNYLKCGFDAYLDGANPVAGFYLNH
jgi:hypothetical protein